MAEPKKKAATPRAAPPRPSDVQQDVTPGGPQEGPQLGDVAIGVTAQLIAMKPGLYAVELGAMPTTRGKGGMVLPCARIDRLPEADGDVHVAPLAASPLVLPGMYPAFVRVSGDASVLLTIYKAAGTALSPELRIRYVSAIAGSAPDSDYVPDSLPLSLNVHVERHGDCTAAGGMWAKSPSGEGAIEGLAIRLQGDLPADAVEYQAILGRDWASPWTTSGEFCGSRGLSLPLIGVRIRMRANFAESHIVKVWGRFAKAGELGPFDGAAVWASAEDTLVGLRLAVLAK